MKRTRCSFFAAFVDPANTGYVEPASHTAGGSPQSTARKRRKTHLSRAEPLAKTLGGPPLIKTTSVGQDGETLPVQAPSPRRPGEDCKRPKTGCRIRATARHRDGSQRPESSPRHEASSCGGARWTMAGCGRLNQAVRVARYE